MTQTLTTTEELKHLASSDNANELTRRLARECLANREAQPVAGGSLECEDELNAALRLHRLKVEGHSQLSDSFRAGFKYARRTAPPAPAYPEILPCAVRLMPGVIFGEGVRTSTMLDGLRRREEYNAEMASMTQEQKDEQYAAILAQARRTAPPAPAVPTFEEWLSTQENKPLGWVRDSMKESYDACRTAMLAAAPEGGNDAWPHPIHQRWISGNGSAMRGVLHA